jgi:hypothetical protein
MQEIDMLKTSQCSLHLYSVLSSRLDYHDEFFPISNRSG